MKAIRNSDGDWDVVHGDGDDGVASGLCNPGFCHALGLVQDLPTGTIVDLEVHATLRKTLTYSIGQRFSLRVSTGGHGDGDIYMLSNCGNGHVAMTNLKSGLFWSAPPRVDDIYRIPKSVVADLGRPGITFEPVDS